MAADFQCNCLFRFPGPLLKSVTKTLMEKKKILVVDNNAVILKLMTAFLTQEGHDVVGAEDAFHALDVLQEFTPQIIYLDLVMPKIGGDSLCKIFRTLPHLANCYIAIVSAVAVEQKLDLLEIGADAYIAKGPFSLMRHHILETIAESDAPRLSASQKTRGIESLHPRQITKELLFQNKNQQLILESISQGVLAITDNRVFYANQAAIFLLQVNIEHLLGVYLDRILDPSIWEKLAPLIEASAETPIEANNTVLKIHDRYITPQCLTMQDDCRNKVVLLTDITERKQAEKKRVLNEQRLHVLLQLNKMTGETLQEFTDFALEQSVRLTQSTIGYLAFLNDDESVLTMHSWSKSAMAECAITDKPFMYPVETTGLWGEAVRQRRPVITNDYNAASPLAKGYPEGHVAVRRHMNIPVFAGSRIVLVAGVGNKAEEYTDEDVQQLTLVMEGVWKLMERKQAENTLLESDKRLQAVFKRSPVGLMLFNSQSVVLDCNQHLANIFGLQREEYIGLNLLDRIPEGLLRQSLLNAISDNGVQHYEGPYTTILGGKQLYVSVFIEKIENNLLIAIISDITESKQAENALRESENKFSLTFNSSPDSININRQVDGLYVDINEGFTRITGYTRDDVIGKTSLELNIWEDPADRQRLVHALQEKGYIENLEAQFRRKDGSLLSGLMSARAILLKGVPHLISITRDISERKKHEKEQLKIDKLESLGILAGGIAHDFNNILTGIMGNISLARVFLDAAHESYNPLSEAEKASERARELANQLLTFARGGEPIKKVVSPQRLVNEALSFILHGSKVKGTVDIPDSIHALEADEGQISQVFHNIIINATQAMPGGGILTVTAQNEVLNDKNTLSLPPGSYIRLTFTDQGCGITDDTLNRIFDPYFTTKSAGIGLGLSSVHSIVSRHGGHIEASSVVGEGTTFTIHLPSIGKVYTEFQADVVAQTTGEHKGGSILVMDDDEMIREIASSMLGHLGYEVTSCTNGEDAIELYKTSMESGTPFLVVIMDLTIPGGIGGKEAAEQILSLFPKACLVVSSGYSNDPIMSNYQEYGFSGVIAKPYNIHNFNALLNSLFTH